MNRILTSSVFSVFSIFLLTGCVSQEKYNAQKMRADQLNEQLGAAQAQLSSATAQNDVFKQQMERIRNSGDNQAALLVNQAATIADQARQLDELNSRYNQAMQAVGKAGSGALPVQLTNELTSFASQNPDLVDFDSARGIVKFKSDVTFDSGSAVVKDTAKNAIDRLASILNGATASQYDLMIVGHTDSQPVSNPATIRAGHLDNWYLSAHRAIAVSKELQKVGVRSGRIEVAGYADQRPLDPSNTKEAMAKNRRVELLILPTTSTGSSPAPTTSAPPVASTPKVAPKAMNKDISVETPSKPIINK
jgi:chemotaxis protein MotB